jgi:hypothetical protein
MRIHHKPCVRAVLTPVVITLGLTQCLPGPTGPVPSPSYRTDYRIVFPEVATGPTLNGLASEAAWSTGFHYVMEDGGSFPAAALRGVATAAAVYLYAEVEDTDFNAADVVVVGINPTNTPNGYHRIHVFPCPVTGVCLANGNTLDTEVRHWTGELSGGAYAWTPVGGTPAVQARSSTSTAGSLKKWAIEMSIPRGAPFNIPADNFFGLFIDVVRTNPAAGIAGEAVQYTWPAGQFIGSTNENDVLSDLETGTLPPNAWGNATLSTAFGNGVTISSHEIRSNHPTDPGKIPVSATPIIFYGTAANYSSTGGTLATAKAVQATFKIANNGLPTAGSFATVPGGVVGPNDIAPTVAHTFQTSPWTLTLQQQTDYLTNPNQCIRVELSSTDPSTIFINSWAMRNMQFVETASPFRERATLTTRGIQPPRGQDTLGFVLRESFVNFDPRLNWTTEIRGARQVGERLYRTAARAGGEHHLEIIVEPPRLRIPSDSVHIAPGTGGPANPMARVPVGPDELVTIIASGSIEIDGRTLTAAGVPEGYARGDQPAPVRDGEQPPAVHATTRRVGALLGSFDGFQQSSFVIGNASTLKVPRGVQMLSLRIEGDPEQYARQRGDGYALQVVRTPIEPWMLAVNPELGRTVSGADVFVNLGANLPTWHLRGERDTGRYLRIGNESFRVYESVGTFGYIVRRIR